MPAPDDLSPAEEAAVRARLAEARHSGPVPAPVATRLDAVLADLTTERREQDAPVVPLPTAASRRRRVLAGGLVAAAAVVALGVALPQVLDTGTSGGDEAASTADRGASATATDGGGAAEAGPGEDAGADDSGGATGQLSESPGSPGRPDSAFAPRLELSSGEPLRPVVRPLARREPLPAYDTDPGCVLDVGGGDRVGATWDGSPALVVLRPAEAGRRLVEVYVCGSGEVVGRTSLPVR